MTNFFFCQKFCDISLENCPYVKHKLLEYGGLHYFTFWKIKPNRLISHHLFNKFSKFRLIVVASFVQ